MWAVGAFGSRRNYLWLHRGNSRGTIVLAGGSLSSEWSVFSGVCVCLWMNRVYSQSLFKRSRINQACVEMCRGLGERDVWGFFSRWRSQPPQPLIRALPRLSELAGYHGNDGKIPSLSSARDQQGPAGAAEGGDALWELMQPGALPRCPHAFRRSPEAGRLLQVKTVNRESIPGAVTRHSCMISGWNKVFFLSHQAA